MTQSGPWQQHPPPHPSTPRAGASSDTPTGAPRTTGPRGHPHRWPANKGVPVPGCLWEHRVLGTHVSHARVTKVPQDGLGFALGEPTEVGRDVGGKGPPLVQVNRGRA